MGRRTGFKRPQSSGAQLGVLLDAPRTHLPKAWGRQAVSEVKASAQVPQDLPARQLRVSFQTHSLCVAHALTGEAYLEGGHGKGWN